MSQGSENVGRQGSTGTFANTIAPKSAEQAMLLKLDEIIDRLNAIVAAVADSEDDTAIIAAVGALTDLEKIKLVR